MQTNARAAEGVPNLLVVNAVCEQCGRWMAGLGWVSYDKRMRVKRDTKRDEEAEASSYKERFASRSHIKMTGLDISNMGLGFPPSH
jgi:hypothetical protein